MKFLLNTFLFLAGNDRGGVFLVPMHGGIWTLCINLRDDEIRELGKKGFPAVAQCFNYLAGNIDNSRSGGGDEPRADWQHSESQTPIHPHLSRYNNNVLKVMCKTLNNPQNSIWRRTEMNLLNFRFFNVYRQTFLISGMKLLWFIFWFPFPLTHFPPSVRPDPSLEHDFLSSVKAYEK